jgi:2'-5' RNA ligase
MIPVGDHTFIASFTSTPEIPESMAGHDQQHRQTSFATNSYDTALCIIPPQHVCEEIDKLRSLYDKAYEKWPPHINLIYPFVSAERLSEAKNTIESHVHTGFEEADSRTVTLGGAGLFKNRKDITIFLGTKGPNEKDVLESIRLAALQALGLKVSPSVFHLTVGQAQDDSVSARQFLLDKVNRLPAFEFHMGSLAILIRERSSNKADSTSQMRLWGSIDLPGSNQAVQTPLTEFWNTDSASMNAVPSERDIVSEPSSSNERRVQPGTTYGFDPQAQIWTPSTLSSEASIPETLSVSSYNVLIDSEYPPARDRDTISVNTILAESALADVLVMQEVSDEFLSHLLEVEEVREVFPYSSHGPPSQSDIGPLPSLRNIVVLSKWHFNWEFVPFQRRHKGAVVASFPSVLTSENSSAKPLVVAGVHLTAGLTDGSVAAKKVQLQNVINHLNQNYPSNAWIVAGDFNLPTSRYTIEEAVKDKSISPESSRILDLTETTMSEYGLLDAWAVARVEGVDETATLDAEGLFEGEEGATFDPQANPLAAYSSGTSENRPQRYDRIFMRSNEGFSLTKFNQFGRPEFTNGTTSTASDHYGIRAKFHTQLDAAHQSLDNQEILQKRVVHHKHTPPELSSTAALTKTLSKGAVFPTEEDEERYKQAFSLITDVILGSTDESSAMSDIPMIMVPVGSYALNVWTPDSDIDCLCIGSISSKTFFRLARQRILRADAKGVRMLRKVEANTGTMLELSVNGVNMDLQYCPAANIVHR